MESGSEPPGAVPLNEHEQRKLVEHVRPTGHLGASCGEREPPHIGDRHTLGHEASMFDLISRAATLVSTLALARLGKRSSVDRMDLVVATDDRSKGAAPQDKTSSAKCRYLQSLSVMGR